MAAVPPLPRPPAGLSRGRALGPAVLAATLLVALLKWHQGGAAGAAAGQLGARRQPRVALSMAMFGPPAREVERHGSWLTNLLVSR